MAFSPFWPLSFGTNSIINAVADALTNLEASIVKSLIKEVISGVAATTDIGLQSNDWFSSVAQLLLPVEELVVAPLLFAATIGAVFRQDMRRLARAWGAALPISLIGGFALVKLTQVGLAATDAISSMVQAQVAPNLGSDFAGAVAAGITGPVAVAPLGALLSLVVMAGGLAIWLELTLRSAAIELAVFFMPLALAGLVWPVTAHWAKRLLEVLGALLLAKPVIVGALCLGTNALTSARAGPSSMVTGAAILLLAAFAPMVLLKLVPIVEVSAIAHLQGVSRQPLHVAERAVRTAMAAVSDAAGARGGGGGGGGADMGAAGQLLAQMGGNGGAEGHPLGPARTPERAPGGGLSAGAVPMGMVSTGSAPLDAPPVSANV